MQAPEPMFVESYGAILILSFDYVAGLMMVLMLWLYEKFNIVQRWEGEAQRGCVRCRGSHS